MSRSSGPMSGMRRKAWFAQLAASPAGYANGQRARHNYAAVVHRYEISAQLVEVSAPSEVGRLVLVTLAEDPELARKLAAELIGWADLRDAQEAATKAGSR